MNEPLPGKLLACPTCLQQGIKQYLGKILDTGDMLVLRFHHGTTILRSKEYSVVCGCGYTFNISGGTVITEEYATI